MAGPLLLNPYPTVLFETLSNTFLAIDKHQCLANENLLASVVSWNIGQTLWCTWQAAAGCHPLLSTAAVLKDKVHDGGQRGLFGTHYACPSRESRFPRFGLPVLGLSWSACANKHTAARGHHFTAVQRVTISGLPEEQRQRLWRWGCFAGKFIRDADSQASLVYGTWICLLLYSQPVGIPNPDCELTAN